MTSKQYLERVRSAEGELRRLVAEHRHQMELATSIAPQGGSDPVKHSRGTGVVQAAATMMAEIGLQLAERVEAYNVLVREARAIVEALPNQRERQLISLRYLCGKSWRAVGDMMGYEDEKSVYRLHGWALRSVQAEIDKRGIQ